MVDSASSLLTRVLAPTAIDAAVLEAVVLSCCADGVVESEIRAVHDMARQLPSFASMDDAALKEQVEGAFERIAREGLEKRLLAVTAAASDDETRRKMFLAAAIVQYADGEVTNEENEFLLDLADALGLSEKIVRGIVEEIERELGIKSTR
ncbi:MAG: TerB family tellurite resistance protein [Myxococcales bacterium]|nr:TerB family tellurite resistance protein [Myxococcales bacterium]